MPTPRKSKSKAAAKSAAKPAAKSPSEQVDEQLARYRSMRRFDVTAEPQGGAAPAAAASGQPLPFLVQKHAATRLHYDFRLGWNGVLKSWAVTKGPSYVTADKRLAVQVEDHPMEYGGFEGTIPKGQYGGGTVMLWDHGTWEPHGDVDDMLARGNLKFRLNGEKLIGDWVLVRMGGRAAANDAKPNWLLIKEHDEYERKASDPPITEEAPDSVVTGRDLDAIGRDEDHVWQSKETAKTQTSSKPGARLKIAPRAPQPAASIDLNAELQQLKAEEMPGFIPPQLASSATTPPADSEDWVHELKLDGYRVQAHIRSGARRTRNRRDHGHEVQLFTRNGLDWTARMSGVADEFARLPVENAVIDGEVVVLNEQGLSSFAQLQASFEEHKRADLTYFAFDLLHLNGHDTRTLPLLERKALLASLLAAMGGSEVVVLSQHIATSAQAMFAEACRLGAEGIVSKRGDARYTSGRSKSWLKLKCVLEQEFVIGGFTLPTNGSHGVGALLLGYYGGGKLVYAGRTGTGFSHATSASLRDRLEELKQSKSAFAEMPREAQRDAHWVTPTLVAQVEFRTWTSDGLIRQSAFKGLREDKAPSEVTREPATAPPPAAPTPNAPGAEPPKPAHTGNPEAKTTALPVRLTHPEKVLDRESGLTKQQFAEYMLAIAPHILPHIAARPLSIIRCPDGTAGKCFFQRHLNKSLPKGVEGIDLKHKTSDEVEAYITLSTAEALVGLAQLNVMELHPWGSKNTNIELPDRLIFDLDPDEALPWPTLAAAAEEVRTLLKELGLKSFVKLTGGKGLHVVAPIRAQHAWPEVKQFAHAFVLSMEQRNPRLYLTKMTKAARKDRIYLDYLRNERGATAVAPYSARARAGVHVSMPLAWSELKQPSRPRYRVVDFAEWRERLRRDPWKELLALDQELPIPGGSS